ncbi:hypothetical protein GGX14DRAFT_697770 [Mycena pura]|uniref:Uncharacterized protein n=1 Tax=Mycena pura TaxID=153505 RepID=A0AAD6VH45_9AGAR|nr:hypothetical protein GGX14DRAFT_697770 [Mycena pura]
MGAKYLCCLPLRLGVLVISFLSFLSSGFAAGILIAGLILDAEGKLNGKLPSRTRIIAIVVAAVTAIAALISLTGFIGAIRKKESYVRAYSALVRIAFSIQVAVSVAFIILFFVDKKEFVNICNGVSSDQATTDDCINSTALHPWAVIVSALIPIVFQAYGVYIVTAYARKLRNEHFLREETFGYKGPGYQPVQEETHPLTHQPAYPYADNSHSFGSQLP